VLGSNRWDTHVFTMFVGHTNLALFMKNI